MRSQGTKRPARIRKWLVVVCSVAVVLAAGTELAIRIPAVDYSRFDYAASLAPRAEHLESGETYERLSIVLNSLDNKDINCYLTLPRTPPPHPAVVFFDGYQEGRAVVDYIDERWWENGYAAMTMDYRYAGSTTSKALMFFQGRRAVNDAVLDVRRVIAYLRTRPDIDTSRIAVMTTSLGAILAPLVVADNPGVKCVVLIQGGGDVAAIARSQFEVNRPLKWVIGCAARIYYSPFEPLKYVKKISPRPALFVIAKEDQLIPLRSANELAEAALQPKEIIYQDAEHLLAGNAPQIDSLLAIAVPWLQKHLRSKN